MVIYTEFLYISVPGIILGIKPKTIAYMTQLTSVNTCVLDHAYIYRISVYFSSRYNSEYQTRNYSAYITQLTSLNTCVLHHGYLYRILFLYHIALSDFQIENCHGLVTPQDK